MAKIKAPKPEATAVEAPTPDYASLSAQLLEFQQVAVDAESSANGANIDCALSAREFIEENPGCERKDIKLAIASAVAEARGIKPADIASAPDKTLKTGGPAKAEKFRIFNSAYTLVSTLLTVAWPTDETAQKKVAKLISDGERGFVKLKAAASKKQSNPNKGPSIITEETFGGKLIAFLEKARVEITEAEGEKDYITSLAGTVIETWGEETPGDPIPA